MQTRRAFSTRPISTTVVAAWLAALSAAGHAQEWPTKAVRLIIPFPPGQTSSDVFGRAMAERLRRDLGQPFVVDNRPGAGGTLGANLVAKSAPDGYTLLLGAAGTITISPSVYGKKLPFNPQTELQPVSLFALVPYMLVVPPSVPAKNIQEFMQLAKDKPGTLNFISSGNGTTPHLCGEWFKHQSKADITHVPYKGGAIGTVDLLAGRAHLYCAGGPSTFGFLQSGKLRAIGMTSAKRSALLPDIPTLGEQGVSGLDNIHSWVGIFAPAGTPRPVINKLYRQIATIMSSAEMKSLISEQAAEPMALTPDQFAARIKSETAYWANVVKITGAKID